MNRAELVEKNHPKLSIRQQCELLSVSRSTLNYTPVEEREEDLLLMRVMDEIYMKDPCLGSRRLVTVLERDHGIKANRKRIQRLRLKMGVETIWCRPRRTSLPDHGHRKYPYLLRDRAVKCADEVWCADITYIPMPHGHAYLCAVMDWHSRKVLGWAVSKGKSAIHMVSAWGRENGMVLGQVKVNEKSNEITAIPELLRTLELAGCIVTIDAMGTQKSIAREIREADADYILALKGNHEVALQEVSTFLLDARAQDNFAGVPHDFLETVEKDHGRIETRRYWITEKIQWFADKALWEGLQSFGMVESTREIAGKGKQKNAGWDHSYLLRLLDF
jgi:putative transposase